MPMSKDDHEAILAKLLDRELDHSERTDLLQTLRADYGSTLADYDDHTKQIEKYQKDNADLVLSNSKLFRQVGLEANPPAKEEATKKEFSETITLEEALGGKE